MNSIRILTMQHNDKTGWHNCINHPGQAWKQALLRNVLRYAKFFVPESIRENPEKWPEGRLRNYLHCKFPFFRRSQKMGACSKLVRGQKSFRKISVNLPEMPESRTSKKETKINGGWTRTEKFRQEQKIWKIPEKSEKMSGKWAWKFSKVSKSHLDISTKCIFRMIRKRKFYIFQKSSLLGQKNVENLRKLGGIARAPNDRKNKTPTTMLSEGRLCRGIVVGKVSTRGIFFDPKNFRINLGICPEIQHFLRNSQ